MRDFHLLVNGEAREWFWLFLKTNENVDWPKLIMGLERQYQNTTSNFQITVEMATRKQGENESVDSFFHDMVAWRNSKLQWKNRKL